MTVLQPHCSAAHLSVLCLWLQISESSRNFILDEDLTLSQVNGRTFLGSEFMVSGINKMLKSLFCAYLCQKVSLCETESKIVHSLFCIYHCIQFMGYLSVSCFAFTQNWRCWL